MCLHVVARDFGLRDSLTFLLAAHGFRVAAHASAEAFRAAGEPKTSDAVILDLDLSGLEGPQLVAWLQSLPRPPRVIALSGINRRAIQAQLHGLGWPILLEKPFIAVDLLQLL